MIVQNGCIVIILISCIPSSLTTDETTLTTFGSENFHSNDTGLNCSFSLNAGGDKLTNIIFSTFNTSKNDFLDIARIIYVYDTLVFYKDGGYLQGRVNHTLMKNSYGTLIFNELRCEDRNIYKCRIEYIENSVIHQPDQSNPSRIVVKVQHSKPVIEVRGKLSALEEDGNLMVSCTCNMGHQTAYFDWFKIYNGVPKPLYYSDVNTTFDEIPDLCSYNGSSSINIRLKAQDDKVQIRCSLDLGKEILFDETAALNVKYGVRKPLILKYPNMPIYKENSAPITLNCSGNGNPRPTYMWLKNDSIDTILANSNIYVISNMYTNNSGTYECEVRNEVSGKNYRASSEVNITIVSASSENDGSTTITEILSWFAKLPTRDKILLLVGIIIIIIIIIFLVVFILRKCCRRKQQITKKITKENKYDKDNDDLPIIEEKADEADVGNASTNYSYGEISQEPKKKTICSTNVNRAQRKMKDNVGNKNEVSSVLYSIVDNSKDGKLTLEENPTIEEDLYVQKDENEYDVAWRVEYKTTQGTETYDRMPQFPNDKSNVETQNIGNITQPPCSEMCNDSTQEVLFEKRGKPDKRNSTSYNDNHVNRGNESLSTNTETYENAAIAKNSNKNPTYANSCENMARSPTPVDHMNGSEFISKDVIAEKETSTDAAYTTTCHGLSYVKILAGTIKNVENNKEEGNGKCDRIITNTHSNNLDNKNDDESSDIQNLNEVSSRDTDDNDEDNDCPDMQKENTANKDIDAVEKVKTGSKSESA